MFSLFQIVYYLVWSVLKLSDPARPLSPCSVTVHIEVEDVNEYEPRFTEHSYILDVDEGRLYDEIVQVAAEDEDCSPKVRRHLPLRDPQQWPAVRHQ